MGKQLTPLQAAQAEFGRVIANPESTADEIASARQSYLELKATPTESRDNPFARSMPCFWRTTLGADHGCDGLFRAGGTGAKAHNGYRDADGKRQHCDDGARALAAVNRAKNAAK